MRQTTAWPPACELLKDGSGWPEQECGVTFLTFVAVFVGLACLGVPLAALAAFEALGRFGRGRKSDRV